MWDKLTEDEKEAYLKKSHTLRLAYKYKTMLYKKKIKKILPKKPANAYGQFLKEKKGMKVPEGERPLTYWASIYEQLSKEEKNKYEEKASLKKKEYIKKMDEFKNYIFDIPKKPATAFILFFKDRIPDLKAKNKDASISEFLEIAAKEWSSEEGKSKDEYNKMALQDKRRYKKQMKEFETFGYYKKDIRNQKEEDESEEERTTKRKRRSKSSKKIITKKPKSMSKTKDSKRGAKSRKKFRI